MEELATLFGCATIVASPLVHLRRPQSEWVLVDQMTIMHAYELIGRLIRHSVWIIVVSGITGKKHWKFWNHCHHTGTPVNYWKLNHWSLTYYKDSNKGNSINYSNTEYKRWKHGMYRRQYSWRKLQNDMVRKMTKKIKKVHSFQVPEKESTCIQH